MTADPKSITPVDARVGARIKMRRMLLGITQTELGRSAGVTFQQIQKYENGTNRITVSRLHDIAQALGTGIEFFDVGGPGRSSAASTEVGELAPLLATPEAIRLLKAFRDIGSANVRRGLVALAKQLAGGGGGHKTGGRPAPLAPAGAPRRIASRPRGKVEPASLPAA